MGQDELVLKIPSVGEDSGGSNNPSASPHRGSSSSVDKACGEGKRISPSRKINGGVDDVAVIGRKYRKGSAVTGRPTHSRESSGASVKFVNSSR